MILGDIEMRIKLSLKGSFTHKSTFRFCFCFSPQPGGLQDCSTMAWLLVLASLGNILVVDGTALSTGKS